jgi:hypothetical protein
MKKYAVVNPLTGTYTYTNTIEERDSLLAAIAWEYYTTQTYNQPYSIVTINEDGSETWTTPDGTPKLSPQELDALSAQWSLDLNTEVDTNSL